MAFDEIWQAHQDGDVYIPKISYPDKAYGIGWSLHNIVSYGFTQTKKPKPPKSLSTLLHQITEFLISSKAEYVGPLCINNLETYSSPYIRADRIKLNELVEAITRFLTEINRSFTQPVSLKLRLSPPPHLEDVLAMVGDRTNETPYSEYGEEVNLFNQALLISMNTLNNQGLFQPTPVYRLDENTQWDSVTLQAVIALAFKFGTPHFEYKTPEPTNIHIKLRRGGGILSYPENTGLTGLVALNLPRIAYRAEDEEEYYTLLEEVITVATNYLDWKHENIQAKYQEGRLPLTHKYLEKTENMSLGITVTGVHEALQNLIRAGIDTMPGKAVTYKTLEHIQDLLTERTDQTGNNYTLEQTHLDDIPEYFAEKDIQKKLSFITNSNNSPYYTPNSQLPIDHGDDLWEALEHQQRIHLQYSGGTLFPVYLRQSITYHDGCSLLIQRILEEFQYQSISISPTFSICPTHGHIQGNIPECPKCGEMVTTYTQVSGIVKRLDQISSARKEEHRLRVPYDVKDV